MKVIVSQSPAIPMMRLRQCMVQDLDQRKEKSSIFALELADSDLVLVIKRLLPRLRVDFGREYQGIKYKVTMMKKNLKVQKRR